MDIIFSILITTRDRINDLRVTLDQLSALLLDNQVECVVFDDGSVDGTSEFIKNNYPGIILKRNETSKGYMFCRNQMLNQTQAVYAISLDDDAHFLSINPLEHIARHFNQNPRCGLIAFRIFWGLETPVLTDSNENSSRVKGFVGCGHAWRVSAWKKIPNYPEWFVFYGEEQFASFQLFKNNWEIDYLPSVLVHHRVDVKGRKHDSDYQRRTRMSLRSGWFLYFLFLPLSEVLKKMSYSFWWQMKTKVRKGDWKATKGILQALRDLVITIPKLITNRDKLSNRQYQEYSSLEETKIYWKPND